MATLTKRERVTAALRGEPVDRVPVAAWRHFVEDEWSNARLAGATLAHWRSFDWDWIKLNPRATHFAEAWGNVYDPGTYTGVLPRLVDAPLREAGRLAGIQPVPATEGVFGEQLDLLRRVRNGAGDTLVLQTVFSPLSVLAFLTAQPGDQMADLGLGSNFEHVRQLIDRDPESVHAALDAIASTLAEYAASTLEAGADGIFFAVVRLARAGVLSPEQVERFVLPYDRRVLDAVAGAQFNLLHICGPNVFFDQLAELPAHAISWATTDTGNPSVAEAASRTGRALVGGVDEAGALLSGSAEQVEAEALAAIAGGGPRLLLSPGCGVDPSAPDANLHALRRAAERAAVDIGQAPR